MAAARVVRLITTDQITAPARDALMRRLPDTPTGHLAGYLITCPWCVSIWVGAVAAPVALLAGANLWLLIPALALAISYATGVVSDLTAAASR
jgi:Protein of unknown function (DUF1360)